MHRYISRLFPPLHEVALLLWTAALFLPWFYDPIPRADAGPTIDVGELMGGGQQNVIIAAYALGLLAYVLSRFFSRKGAALLILGVTGCVFYYITLMGGGGLPGRSLSSIYSGYPPAAGTAALWGGLLAMFLAMLAPLNLSPTPESTH